MFVVVIMVFNSVDYLNEMILSRSRNNSVMIFKQVHDDRIGLFKDLI